MIVIAQNQFSRTVSGGGGAAFAFAFLLLYGSLWLYDDEFSVYHFAIIKFVAIFIFALLLYINRRGVAVEYEFNRHWAIMALAFFFMLVSTLRSDRVLDSLEKYIYILVVVLFGFVCRYFFCGRAVKMLPAIALGFGLAHFMVLLEIFYLIFFKADVILRVDAGIPHHSNIRHVSYHGMMVACLSFIALQIERRYKVFLISAAIAAVFGLFYFGSRGALISWFVFLFLATCLVKNNRGRVLLDGAFILTAVWAIDCLFSLGNIRNPFGSLIGDRIKNFGDLYGDSGRVAIWKLTYGYILERPFFGYGADGFRLSDWRPVSVVQPHNIIVQLLLEYGLVGAGLLIYCFIMTFGRNFFLALCVRAQEDVNQGAYLLLALIFSVAVYSMVDGVFYHGIPLLLVSIIVSLYISILSDGRRSSQI